MTITVYAHDNVLTNGQDCYPCAVGINGYTPEQDGREGDGKTPLGTYKIRYGLYRADRVARPETSLIMHPLSQDDGWCDDINDLAYNTPVRRPYPASNEQLFRDSHVYDIILVLGHNDSPPMLGLGSAIFMHIARPHYAPTQGCVAVTLEDMHRILNDIRTGSEVGITSR